MLVVFIICCDLTDGIVCFIQKVGWGFNRNDISMLRASAAGESSVLSVIAPATSTYCNHNHMISAASTSLVLLLSSYVTITFIFILIRTLCQCVSHKFFHS